MSIKEEHLSAEVLAAFFQGCPCSEEEAREMDIHLSRCPSCEELSREVREAVGC